MVSGGARRQRWQRKGEEGGAAASESAWARGRKGEQRRRSRRGKGEEAGSHVGGEERQTRRGRKGKGKGAGGEGAARGGRGALSRRTAVGRGAAAQILSARVGKGRKGKK